MNTRTLAQVATGLAVLILIIQLYNGYQYFTISNGFGDFDLYIFGVIILLNVGIIAWGILGLSTLLGQGRETKGLQFLRVYQLLQLIPIPFNVILAFSYWDDGVPLTQLTLFFGHLFITVALFVCLLLLYRKKPTPPRIDISAATTTFQPASIFTRLLNFVIDSIFHLIFFSTFLSPIMALLAERNLYSNFIFSLFWILFLILAYSLSEGVFRQSIGKTITGTQVYFDRKTEFTFMAVLGRTLSRLVPFEFISVFDRDGQMWHDSWSGTVVLTAYNEVIEDGYNWNSDLLDQPMLKGGL